MKNPLFLALSLCLAAGGAAQAADAENGRKLARQCSVCHGKLGLATDPEVPNLAGQSAYYLEKSLVAFQKGLREDRRMTLIAEPLTLSEIRDLSAWYASLKVTVAEPE
ncbi:c-type cytochrome [Sedimentitalea arenosa]|jgi:cytochrome c553|uniref:Cytochrome c n=1 Tax=Sedimentitalea arenosa TaxID=2798803 RepID=A0A8J7IJH3_9RHOB|nr:cytochrome c [Arenibacterium arenosum]MBJ6372467.1 cytochrome c [Arenibacterium arenosum]